MSRHSAARRPLTGRTAKTLLALLAAAAALLLVHVPGSDGAFLAKVANSTNNASSNAYFTCTGAGQGSGTTDRSYATYPLAEAAGATTAADVSGNGRTANYSLTGITYGVAGPCPRDYSKAVTFDGLTGFVSDPTGVTSSAQQSDEVWFKTTTTAGGLMLASFSSAALGGGADRPLYMATSGQVVFGVYNGTSVQVAVSPLSYNDGKWHEAQGVFSNTAGCSVYVDGALVATNAAAKTANTFTSFTRLGAGQLNTWPNGTASGTVSAAWKGSMAFASLYTYPLTATQVLQHYRAGI